MGAVDWPRPYFCRHEDPTATISSRKSDLLIKPGIKPLEPCDHRRHLLEIDFSGRHVHISLIAHAYR